MEWNQNGNSLGSQKYRTFTYTTCKVLSKNLEEELWFWMGN
jgi:hypothetical protein